MLDSQQIIEPFLLFCRKDSKFLDCFCSFYTLETPPQHWQFKLQTLYSFLLHYYDQEDFGFNSFRRTLFNSPINQHLSEQGYTISIAEPADHVDDNLYVLEHIEQP